MNVLDWIGDTNVSAETCEQAFDGPCKDFCEGACRQFDDSWDPQREYPDVIILFKNNVILFIQSVF